MTLAELKQAITEPIKLKQINEDYQYLLTASTEDELINSFLDFFEWAYSIGVVTDTLMNGFTQSVLNDNGVYNTGTFTITNPATEDIYITGDANVTVNLTGNARSRVVVLTNNAVVSINASDNAYVKLQSIKNMSPVILSLTNDASCICQEVTGVALITVVASDNSVFHGSFFLNSQIEYTGEDTSVAVVNMFHDSVATYETTVNAVANFTLFNQATGNGSSI